ncbi:ABC transporter substrate-binding protein [Ornithinibacillus californiensis]|uniref:ABC transporter substrate-binding protein n=1 Tax=Ornithinibacillus californiensis TaxID=161536 RepID=UPI00064D9DAE|nr:ABC transporter substrate-binding protein [Ornithinibacillus californiensis]
MKKTIIGLALATTLALTACGTGDTSEDKKQLVISTFGLSEDIVQEDVFAPFEEEHNVEIVVEAGGGSERFTKFKNNPNSTVDIIELSQSLASEGNALDLFEKVDAEKVPNMEMLVPAAKELSANGDGPAYTLNSIGIIYNEEAAGMKIDEWADLWDPALKGKVSIPDIATTFGPAMVYMASDYKGVNIEDDNGQAAFEALKELTPNIVKTYSKSSDLANTFQSGEIAVAVIGDFAIPVISEANPEVQYVVPESGTYANFNTMNINKNSENKELAYKFLNWRISQELQETTAVSLNEAPTNQEVVLTDEVAKNKTYGDVAQKAKALNFTFVNTHMEQWIKDWNQIINQ